MRRGRAPMAYAHVTYTHQATGAVYSTMTGLEGEYELSGLTLAIHEQHRSGQRTSFGFDVTNTVGSSRNFFLQSTSPIDKIRVYNILGRQVAEVRLTMEQITAAHWMNRGFWDGRADDGTLVADGVYFASALTPSGLQAVKFMHLAGGTAALPQRGIATTLSIPENPVRWTPRGSLDESVYTVTLVHDSLGGRFADTSFTRLLHEGDNGFVMDTVTTLPPLRVLFVGNSYTYYNGGVSEHVHNLMMSADSTSGIYTSMIAYGGFTLQNHWGNADTRSTIQNGRWDLVILQEQSTRPVDEPQLMYAYAILLDSLIRISSAETGFYMTWGRQNRPFMIDTLAAAYEFIGGQLQAMIAPVGRAFQRCIEHHPLINLYDTDGSHPSVWGTYLACCVFYASIWNYSPLGISYVNDPRITDEERTILQTVAWETVTDYHP
jgi:hypothetical protein